MPYLHIVEVEISGEQDGRGVTVSSGSVSCRLTTCGRVFMFFIASCASTLERWRLGKDVLGANGLQDFATRPYNVKIHLHYCVHGMKRRSGLACTSAGLIRGAALLQVG